MSSASSEHDNLTLVVTCKLSREQAVVLRHRDNCPVAVAFGRLCGRLREACGEILSLATCGISEERETSVVAFESPDNPPALYHVRCM